MSPSSQQLVCTCASAKTKDSICPCSIDIINTFVCSNKNRAVIIYLLNKSPNKEMKVEEIANKLGISHRTTLYHLDILAGCNLVEVRKYRKKGLRNLRSVWGISSKNKDVIFSIFSKVEKYFTKDELECAMNMNVARR